MGRFGGELEWRPRPTPGCSAIEEEEEEEEEEAEEYTYLHMLMKYFKSAVPDMTAMRMYEIVLTKLTLAEFVLNININIIIIIIIDSSLLRCYTVLAGKYLLPLRRQ
jgi:CO dehydrogenase/acetyl-CoA synthase beta subunit